MSIPETGKKIPIPDILYWIVIKYMKIVLEEKAMEEYPDFIERTMTVYMVSEKTIQTYVDGMI